MILQKDHLSIHGAAQKRRGFRIAIISLSRLPASFGPDAGRALKRPCRFGQGPILPGGGCLIPSNSSRQDASMHLEAGERSDWRKVFIHSVLRARLVREDFHIRLTFCCHAAPEAQSTITQS